MRQHLALFLLGLSTAGSLMAAASTVLILNPEDRITCRRGMVLTALGLVFFPSLFSLLNACALDTGAGARLRRRYALTRADVLDISNKLVSAVQAVFCCVTGAVVCLWSCTRDFVRSSHFMSEAYAWFGAAYFFYDIWSMYKVFVYMVAEGPSKAKDKKLAEKQEPKPIDHRPPTSGDGLTPVAEDIVRTEKAPPPPSFLAYCKEDPIIIGHHLFIGGFGFLVIVYLRGDLGDCVFGFAYLMELSTPLVSLRGILSRMRLKGSPLYLANGLAMLVVFLLCRVVSLPAVAYMYARYGGQTYLQAISSLPLGCKVSILILLLPQLYWFYLMSAGAVKVFFPREPPRAKPGRRR